MRTPPILHSLVLSGLATWLGCTGAIDDERGSRTGAEAGGPSLPGVNPPVTDPSILDEEMRAQDPVLFDLATKYFPGTTAAGGKKRLFRLTRTQLDLTTQTILPESYQASIATVMPSDPLQTNYEYSEVLSWNDSNLTPYTGWVTAIAERVAAKPQSVVSCAATDAACLELGADAFVTRAFRGVVTPEQLDRFSSFYVTSAAAHGFEQATADLVDVTLTSPSYLFREEVATGADGALLAHQQLQNLAYALSDAPPEALQLSSASAAAAQVEAALASPLVRDKLMRFFLAWLEVKEPADFALAANVFPEWTEEVAAAAVANTKAFLARELAGPAPSLKTITSATDAFASPETAFLYDTTVATSNAVVPLEPSERIGIFTQPAVIASHSGPTTTRLVKRGVFFTRKVMCLPLGAPPPGVNTMLPMTPNATERQRIESITVNQPCAGCHSFINPFGSMQEGYDAIGRFRTRDEMDLPVDASIKIEFLDEGTLETQTGVEALRGLTSSTRFKQCFTRQLFRYYMGREEESTDDPVLRQMFFAFAKDDKQDILAALRALLSSVSFTHRTEAP